MQPNPQVLAGHPQSTPFPDPAGLPRPPRLTDSNQCGIMSATPEEELTVSQSTGTLSFAGRPWVGHTCLLSGTSASGIAQENSGGPLDESASIADIRALTSVAARGSFAMPLTTCSKY
jgi:hypothetical protein